MDDDLIVGLDMGTSAVDACVFTGTGQPVQCASVPLVTHNPTPGWREQDPSAWSAAAVQALRQVAQSLGQDTQRVTAIGLAGQCPSFALVDARGVPLTSGMIYQDNRATLEAREMGDLLDTSIVRLRSGLPISHFLIVPKILWLKKRQSDLRAAQPWLAQPRDLVVHHLTGVWATDPTHAGCTGLYDLQTRTWATDWRDTLDLRWLRLPPVFASQTVIGPLLPGIADDIGFPAATLVVLGAADNFCADLALGAIVSGILADTTGTSTCLDITIDHPDPHPALSVYAHLAPEPLLYFANVGLNATGTTLRWAAELLAGGDVTLLNRMAATTPPACHAPLFLPYLGDGERSSAAALGGWQGIRLSHQPAQLARSVYEGITFALRELIGDLRQVGQPLAEARLGGGGSRSQFWSSLKATIWHLPTRRATNPDATALGAALLAGIGIGLYRDLAEAVALATHLQEVQQPDMLTIDLYDDLYTRWQQAVGASRRGVDVGE